jgi:hypothetical protein
MRRRTWIPRLENGIMGRQQVVQITCDRCTRIEHRPIRGAEGPKHGDGFDFKASFMGDEVEFEDLCTPCQEIVRGHWDQINKSLHKQSPRRPKKSEG